MGQVGSTYIKPPSPLPLRNPETSPLRKKMVAHLRDHTKYVVPYPDLIDIALHCWGLVSSAKPEDRETILKRRAKLPSGALWAMTFDGQSEVVIGEVYAHLQLDKFRSDSKTDALRASLGATGA